MRTPMIGNRMRAFALSTAFAILCCASPATAAKFDGNWDMFVMTTSGHCGKIKVGLAISKGRISSTSGSFAMHRIHVAGLISGSGPAHRQGHGTVHVVQGQGKVERDRTLRCLFGHLDRRPLLTSRAFRGRAS
jgi:hypothetical protein